jgi:hypothetical protein
MLNVSAQSAACGEAVVLRPETRLVHRCPVDPIWKLELVVLAERKKFDQEGAANAA